MLSVEPGFKITPGCTGWSSLAQVFAQNLHRPIRTPRIPSAIATYLNTDETLVPYFQLDRLLS